MNFTRRKVKGKSRKFHKVWLDEGKRYRIYWRRECFGVRVPPAFYALVRCVRSATDTTESWDFAGARRPYKTYEKAVEACEKNEKVWNAVVALNGEKAVINKLRDLRLRSRAGTGVLSHDMLASLPKWAFNKLARRIIDILFPEHGMVREEIEICPEPSTPAGGEPDPTDPTRTSDSSASITDATPESPTPASPAEGKDQSMTRTTRRARSKATSTETPSSAPAAEEPAETPAKRASKRTAKPSKTTARKQPSTKRSSASGGKRSKGSKRKKSTPSAS